MKTKKGKFDFAFNLQAVMTNNHILFTSILLAQPNNQKLFEDVYNQIKKTLCVFLKMNNMYGERNNYGLFLTSFLNIIIVADAGYFTIKNLYFIFIHGINALIMPNTEARKENNILREKNRKSKKKKISLKEKYFYND